MESRKSINVMSMMFSIFALSCCCSGAVTFNVKCGESIADAVAKVGALSAAERMRGVEIVLEGGRHVIANTLQFGSKESGNEGAPLTIKSAKGSHAILCGGTQIPASSFAPVTDQAVLRRIDDSVKSEIRVADLSKIPVKYWNTFSREFRMPLPVPELFVDGERMQIAQWPNGEEWTTIDKFIDQGTRSASGNVTNALGNDPNKKPDPPRGGTFGYAGDRPSRWTNAGEVWLYGFWCFDWYDSVIPVANINTASNTVTFAAKHEYGIRKGNPNPRRWRAVHLLEELDVPGEYFVDRFAKKLYFLPKKKLEESSRIVFAAADIPLVNCDKAHDIVFSGIKFEEGYGSGAFLKKCERIEFKKCEFKNFRKKAIYGEECSSCRITGCDVSFTGMGGINLSGGDRMKLIPGENVIEDTKVHDFSILRRTYTAAIQVGGVGNVVRHCELFNTPHMAVGISGNDNIFEYNVVSNACLSSDDAAAYYKGRNPSMRGNIVRYNFWSNIGSPQGHGTAAIYLDDGDCGDYVIGNVFYKCGEPGFGGFGTVFCHGGHSNIVRNCIFIDCKRPLGSSPWDQNRWAKFMESPLITTRLLKEVCVTNDTWVAHYPAIKDIFMPEADEKRWNAADDNAFVNCPLTLPGRTPDSTLPGIVRGRWATNSTDVIFAADPGFADPARKNFALRKDAELYKQIPNFKPIPFEKIGLLNKR